MRATSPFPGGKSRSLTASRLMKFSRWEQYCSPTMTLFCCSVAFRQHLIAVAHSSFIHRATLTWIALASADGQLDSSTTNHSSLSSNRSTVNLDTRTSSQSLSDPFPYSSYQLSLERMTWVHWSLFVSAQLQRLLPFPNGHRLIV